MALTQGQIGMELKRLREAKGSSSHRVRPGARSGEAAGTAAPRVVARMGGTTARHLDMRSSCQLETHDAEKADRTKAFQ